MRSKFQFAVLVLLLGSVGVGAMLCEFGLRLAFNPADYLSPTMLQDDRLGMAIAPNSSGYDEWGFRNRERLRTADVVTIGDSHTYGNTAVMEDSWPSVVGKTTGMTVYNLGMGGYGPNQYYYLLSTKGFQLYPKWVLCGLYMGDDFENAYMITYGLDSWSSLRNGRRETVDPNIWRQGDTPVWGAPVRNWLSEHSLLYRVVFHGPLTARLKEAIQFNQAVKDTDPNLTALLVEGENIREAFRPLGMAERQDQKNSSVQEGVRITLHLLGEMSRGCVAHGCKFVVVIIPTKEMVFSDYFDGRDKIHLRDALKRVVVNEQSMRSTVFKFLDEQGIAYIDTLPALKSSVRQQLYAPSTRDMHPGKNGYRVIGETVARYLGQSSAY